MITNIQHRKAYGMHLAFSLNELHKWHAGVLACGNGADIHIEIEGQVAEMTFKEFFNRLGITYDEMEVVE